MVKKEHPIAKDIQDFFGKVLVLGKRGQYKYADYSDTWLRQIGLTKNSEKESAASRTTKELQKFLQKKIWK